MEIYIGIIILCIILFVIIAFYLFTQPKRKENMTQNKIPLDIYQTWHSKNLPLKMEECVNTIKRENPEFRHHLYDDNDCREFIKKNFNKEVLDAYNKLIPGAYKADLWRYCILYKNGGVYLDIKLKPVNGFKLIELTDKNYYVLDRPYINNNISLKEELELVNKPNYYNIIYDKIDKHFWKDKKIGIYNAFIVSEPENPLLLDCINKIVLYCKNKYYGYNSLYITGPGLMGELEIGNDLKKYNNFDLFNSQRGNYIINKKGIILKHYDEYRIEQRKNQELPHYHELWANKQVYHGL